MVLFPNLNIKGEDLLDIVVLIKQVPGTTEVKVDKKTGTLIREGTEGIVNPEDLHGLEAALQLKERVGGKVTAITMGPPPAKEALQEALAMGVDRGILLTDKNFGGADTLATSYVLGKCIQKIEDYDLIICGRQAIDGDTAQIGPGVAEFLDIPQITYVSGIDIEGESIIANRLLDDGVQVVQAKLPALVTVVKELNRPRYCRVPGVMEACSENATIDVWNAADIGANAQSSGLKGSPTNVRSTYVPEHKREGELLEGSKEEIASALINKLRSKNLLRGLGL